MRRVSSDISSFAQVLIALLLVGGFLKVAKTITLPFAISVLLAVALMPLVQMLLKRRVPAVVASVLCLSLVFLLFAVMAAVFFMPMRQLSGKLPAYTQRLNAQVAEINQALAPYGVDINFKEMIGDIDGRQIVAFVESSMVSLFVLVKYGTLVFFITLFLLVESPRIREKIMVTYDGENRFPVSIGKIRGDMQRYLIVKTLVSLGTGACVYVFLSLLGMDFAIIWGLSTFVLNFIPSVGSIIAAVPPIFMALVQFESPLEYALVTAAGLLVIQTVLGSYLDPRIMGESLNISTLVVFMSVVFWGWMWGPVGMFIAVPLTVCAKVILAHNKKTEHLAKLLQG